MYAPVSGTVVAAKQAVIETPELLQNDPYQEGWLLKITPADPAQMEQLMDATSYSAKVEGGS